MTFGAIPPPRRRPRRTLPGVSLADVKAYCTPGPMTTLPDDPRLSLDALPAGSGELRRVVQGLLLHRDWAPRYGVEGDAIRLDEQNLRSTAEVLTRAAALSPQPVTVAREPVDRVLCICRHFALLHVAFLRAVGVAARVRCGFSNYFDQGKWYDHWITERWDDLDERWVREDPQIDDLQAADVACDFDPYDQPPGPFLTGAEAWVGARAGEVDPEQFGIFNMWGLPFIAGNVILDLACLNKVEMLPWDGWGMITGPFEPVSDEAAAVLDEVAALAVDDDLPALRARYASDDRLRVPPDITTMVDGQLVPVHLAL